MESYAYYREQAPWQLDGDLFSLDVRVEGHYITFINFLAIAPIRFACHRIKKHESTKSISFSIWFTAFVPRNLFNSSLAVLSCEMKDRRHGRAIEVPDEFASPAQTPVLAGCATNEWDRVERMDDTERSGEAKGKGDAAAIPDVRLSTQTFPSLEVDQTLLRPLPSRQSGWYFWWQWPSLIVKRTIFTSSAASALDTCLLPNQPRAME
jgi:hypothetical protein